MNEFIEYLNRAKTHKIKYTQYKNFYQKCNKYSYKKYKDKTKVAASKCKNCAHSIKIVLSNKRNNNKNEINNNIFKGNSYF